MEFALGVLMWSPQTFWNSTFPEWWAAVKGYRRANGTMNSTDDVGMTMQELDEMQERVG